MREPPASVKARRPLPPEPRFEVSAAEAHILALPHRRQLATPDRLVDVPAREAQLAGDLGHGEEFVSARAGAFLLVRPRGADHPRPQDRADLL